MLKNRVMKVASMFFFTLTLLSWPLLKYDLSTENTVVLLPWNKLNFRVVGIL